MNARPHGNRLSPDNASAHENRARDFSPALRFCNFVDEYVADFWKELSRRPEASFRAAHQDLLGVEARVPAEKVVAFDDYVGPGYSLPTDAMVEAVKMLAETEGILLDPVYSGKAMSGLIDLARKGYFAKGSKVLFLHTGGSPALYAYLPCFR